MSGHLVFNVEDILQWRRWEPDTPIILVRNDTVPDDIREVSQVNGLLTARGGVTSHAAVIAHRLEKTCVVGCGNMVCDEKEQTCNFNGRNLKSGDYISIDGHEGSVYIGKMKIKNT
jgi:pyruvate,orthophosphate dikinase